MKKTQRGKHAASARSPRSRFVMYEGGVDWAKVPPFTVSERDEAIAKMHRELVDWVSDLGGATYQIDVPVYKDGSYFDTIVRQMADTDLSPQPHLPEQPLPR